MITVTQMYDGTYIIVGITYAEIEDLISAYDNNLSLFPFPSDDLSDPASLEPLRQLTAPSQEAHSYPA